MGESSTALEEFEMNYNSENSPNDLCSDVSYTGNEEAEEEDSDNQCCSSSGPQNRHQYLAAVGDEDENIRKFAYAKFH